MRRSSGQASSLAFARYGRTIAALKLEMCRATARFDESRGYESLGCRSTVEWQVKHLGITQQAAVDRLVIGRAILRGERRMLQK